MTARQLLATLLAAAAFVLGCCVSHLVFGQVPKQAGPLGVPPSVAEAQLGKRLFFDSRLSANGTISCSTCHNPLLGWSDGNPVAIGIFGQAGTRNSPTLVNVGYVKPFAFWDGRAVETTDQSILPLSNPIEMGRQTIEQVVARLNANGNYVADFARVFGIDQQTGRAVTATRLARSLASFEATLNSFNAPIDRYEAGDKNALTPEARIGYELCKKAACFECHPAPLYTDNRLHNCGFEYATRGTIADRGRAVVTNVRADIGSFKTPTLRSIARTAPYAHNGRMPDIASVVRHFNSGGYVVLASDQRQRKLREANIDQRIKPQGWTETQQGYVRTFLLTAFEGADYPLIYPPGQ